MNKKGFTLIELIVTIAIILSIVAIAIPSTISLIENNKDKQYDSYVESFISLAKTYFDDFGYEEDEVVGDSCYQITLEMLVNENYLDEIPNNPETDEAFTGGVEITKNSEEDELNYEYASTSACSTNFADLLAYIENDDEILMTPDNNMIDIGLDVPEIVRQLMAKGNYLYIQSSKDVSRSGIYMDDDDFGKTYYFYGNKNKINNVVEYAGHKWMIVRVNGDETVRLISLDTINLNEGNSNLDSDGKIASELGTHVFRYEDEKPNDMFEQRYKNNIQLYNIAFNKRDVSDTIVPEYDIYDALNNWLNTNIIDQSKLVNNNSSTSQYFCAENSHEYYIKDELDGNDYYINSLYDAGNNTSFKCNNTCTPHGLFECNNSNNVNTAIEYTGFLTKTEIEYAGLNENGTNSFLSNGTDWLTNTFYSAYSGYNCTRSVYSNRDGDYTDFSGCDSNTAENSLTTNITNRSSNYFTVYYVNGATTSTKEILNVEGNIDTVRNKNTKISYISDENGDYAKKVDVFKYYPVNEVKYKLKDGKYMQPRNGEEGDHVKISDDDTYISKSDVKYTLITCRGGARSYREVDLDKQYKYMRIDDINNHYAFDPNKRYIKDSSGNYIEANKYQDALYIKIDSKDTYTSIPGNSNGPYFKVINHPCSGYTGTRFVMRLDSLLYYNSDTDVYSSINDDTEYEKVGNEYYEVYWGGDYYALTSPQFEKVETSDGKIKRYTQGQIYTYDYRPLEITVENMGVRPVINLASDTRIKSGSGTVDDPFKLEFIGE